MSILENEEDKIVHIPSWCAAMQDQIDFEEILEEEGLNRSEGLRIALDEYFELPHIKAIIQSPIKK